MPSNAHSKTSGSKKENKYSVPKNASQAVPTEDKNPTNTKANPMKPPDKPNPQVPTRQDPPSILSADQAQPATNNIHDTADEVSSGVGVNKKKQKRRQKEAARKAAEQSSANGPQLAQQLGNAGSTYQDIVTEMAAAQARGEANGYDYGGSDYEDPEHYEPEEDALYYGNPLNQQYQDPYAPRPNGHMVHDYVPQDALIGKSKKKKKSKANSFSQDVYSMENPSLATQRSFHPPPPPPPPPSNQHIPLNSHGPTQNESKDRIWNTSTNQERERIKEFWLSLGEEDRRSLVKVEKEAVLKKMKEQQKHSCSCTVCGRKRTAIEEEVEVLYDAYYEELEVYANPSNGSYEHGVTPRMYAHPMARMPPNRHTQMQNRQVSRSRIQELRDDEDIGDEEEYSEDEDDEEISEDELEEQAMRPIPSGTTDFFNFGKSLTVQGGILTVADDLLKNDGKKFIEMMEQLAERRMQREEEQFNRAGVSHQPLPPHSHGPPAEDDGYDDEEDDEEYDEDEEEFDEEDEMESMTENERMEEGRRMFQIFAARMFEQRVLTAYREKVAFERQQKLLEELDDESRVDAQREAKKAKEAQKKKDKKRQQKEAKDAEKSKREAEKAAEEAAAKALEEKKAEEIRLRKEEQRKKREAEKKAQEEEKQRKEVEKQRRIQEAKEQQAEAERKQREQKDREKKKREDTKKKEREEREAKEREAKEKRERDAAEKKEREAKAKADDEAKERLKQDAQLAPKKKSPAPIPFPPGLHPPLTSSSHTSPRLQIATPVVPKAPTPVRLRQASFQESHNISPKTSQPASSSTTTSPGVTSGLQNGLSTLPAKSAVQETPVQPAQLPSRYSPRLSPAHISHPPGLPSMPQAAGNVHPSAFGPPLSPTASQLPNPYSNQHPIGSGPQRGFMPPNGIPYPPGIGGPSHMGLGRGGTMGPPLPQISTGGFPGINTNDVGRYGMSRDNISSQSHSRNTSASFDRTAFDTPSIPAQAQPIARPAPIKRPSSVAPYQQSESFSPRNADVDDLSNHLGSSALIDDTDTINFQMDEHRHGSIAHGVPRNGGQGFGATPAFPNPIGLAGHNNFPRGMQAGNVNTWSNQPSPFGAPPMSGPPTWSNPPGFGRTHNGNGFGTIGGPGRPSGSRAVTIRLLVRTACEKLRARQPVNANHGFHHADDVLREVQMSRPGHEAPIQMVEMLDICDTEGNTQNGGGSFFKVPEDQGHSVMIRFDPARNTSMSGRGAGEIGSPIVGGGIIPTIGGQRPFQQPGGL